MSSPFSGPVLLGAALLSSPALYAALVTGSLSTGTAAVRFLVAATVLWAGLSLVGALLQTTSAAPPPGGQTETDPWAGTEDAASGRLVQGSGRLVQGEVQERVGDG